MNDTLNRQEANLIQYIMWCIVHVPDPLTSIQYEVRNSGLDLDTLWHKFIVSRNILWYDPLPTTDSADDKVLA